MGVRNSGRVATRLTAVTVAMTMTLSGCAQDGKSSSNASPAPTVASATAVTEVQAQRIDGDSVPVEVEGAPATLRSRSDEHFSAPYEHAAWPELTDDPVFSTTLAESTEQARRAFRDDAPRPTDEPYPSFNQSWALTVSSPDVLAVTLRRDEFLGASGATGYVTYVRHDGRTETGSALLTTDGQPKVTELVLSALRSAGQKPWGSGDLDAMAILDTAVINPAGDLVIMVPAGTAMAYAEGGWTVTIPAAQAEPLLSDTGRKVRTAAMGGRPVTTPTGQTAGAGDATASAPAATDDATSDASSTSAAPGSSTGSASVDCAVAKCVALTFDDGPGPYTAQLLDELRTAGAHATFFTVGRAVSADPATVKRAAEEGHAIGVHTWDHPDLTRLSADKARSNIERGAPQAIQDATGTRPTLLRPPYGAFRKGKTPDDGLAVINWDVDTEDWKNRSAQITTQRALAGVHPGAIILMHDIHPSSVKAVPGLVAALKAKGYTLVTVPELIGDPRPGTVYFSRPSR